VSIEQYHDDSAPETPRRHPAADLDVAHTDPHSSHNQFREAWLAYIRTNPGESDRVVALARNLNPEESNSFLAGFVLGLVLDWQRREVANLEQTLILPSQDPPIHERS